MGEKMKIFGASTGIIIGLLLVIFLASLGGLGYYKFFAPKMEDARREVFENTKSYLHGVQQDLGKYYLEYQKADTDGKEAIRATIQMRFAEVDVSKIRPVKLQTFLTNMRGY
jgi:hypothetical protein